MNVTKIHDVFVFKQSQWLEQDSDVILKKERKQVIALRKTSLSWWITVCTGK